MKYMGSKRWMLKNGLGDTLDKEMMSVKRFIDLFSGSAAVACHVASKYPIPVLACDLQNYSAILASAVLSRNKQLEWEPIWKAWYGRVEKKYRAKNIPKMSGITRKRVQKMRIWCAKQADMPITKSYGAHYFSPHQSVLLDIFRASLPNSEPERTVALSALIQAGSKCAASPGHTAQPFQPTRTAKPFLKIAWERDIVSEIRNIFAKVSSQYAKKKGSSITDDANNLSHKIGKHDLVFIDPPYSGVHYSRFYHVLETIAQGNCGEVTGVGRYPVPALRPRSKYSMKSEAKTALQLLFKNIASKHARAIVTFPDHTCSNGLSGNDVRLLANKHFSVKEKIVNSRFSTLGGNATILNKKKGRDARLQAKELILVLRPKSYSKNGD